MGVGKTTIGLALANMLKMKFLDVDWEIEAKEGRKISRIFEESGETYFRDLERKFIENLPENSGSIVSCGGGLPIADGMMDLLKRKGVVMALWSKPETILERTSRNNKRPLLNTENPEQKIRDLLAAREPIYLKADVSILTDVSPLSEILDHAKAAYSRMAQK